MTVVKLILDVKDSTWIAANPAKVLSLNEPIYRNDGLVAYGDGVTPLSGLVFKPLFSGGGTWGSITGTLSSQTDLQTALDDRELLANKKNTVTNSTTDYPNGKAVYDEFAKLYSVPPIYSGKGRGFTGVTASTAANLAGKIWYVPYLVCKDHSVVSIISAVTTGVAGGTVRMALYADNSGQPSALIEDTGDVSAVGTGDKVAAFLTTRSLTGQLAWMAIQTSSNTIALRFWSGGLNIVPRISGTAPHVSFTQNQAYGAFPANASSLAAVGPNNQPVLELVPA